MKIHPTLTKVSTASKVVFGWAMLFLLSYCTVTAHSINQQTSQLLEMTHMATATDPFTTSWTTTSSSGGTLNHTVTTTPNEGETEAETATRHARRVAALEAVFPPE